MKKLILALMIVVSALSMRAENKAENSVESAKSTESVVKSMLTGKVTDPSTNEALAGATVIVNGKKTFTDLDGNFTVETVKGKDCEITVAMISYQTEKMVIKSQADQSLNVKLKR